MIEFKEPRVVKLHDFQKRNENHGPDLVPAIDFRITAKGAASELAMIHKNLPFALFYGGESADQQELDLPIDDLSHVRVPCMKSVKFDHEQAGMLLRIEYGVSGDKSDIVLALVKLSKVEVKEKHEGGFVVWSALLSCSCEINEHIIGKVAMLEGYEITITLTSPEVKEEQRDLTEADVFTNPVPDSTEKPLTPEDVFVNSSTPAEPAETPKPTAKGGRKAKA